MTFHPVRERVPVRISEFSASRTVQADKERTDIRVIVAAAMRGKSVNVNVRQGTYGDISDAPTFMEALNVVARAQALFEGLPAKLRDRFGNDPAKLLEFVADPENKDEAVKLGIMKKVEPPKEQPPMKVEVVNPAVAPVPDKS